MEREKDEEEGGYTGVPRFMALTSASFSTRCSQPVCHAPHPHPPSSLALSTPPPKAHWSAVKEGKTVWEGAWDKTDPFSLDAVLCQACRDTFKDEGEVNVVGRMREPL